MESATSLRHREEDDDELYDYEVQGPPPTVTREEPVAFPVIFLETIGIFLAFGIFYALFGYYIVADLHVVNFDALDRLTRAFMVWYNDPPKLAAIGFSFPPLSSFAIVPFAAVKSFVTSGFALPLSSAVFAAGALTFVNRMLAVSDMGRIPRLLIVALVGLNPMFVYYATNGTGDAAYMFALAFGLFCLLGWGRNRSGRYLIGAGLALAFAALTKYEFIFWALLIGFIISWALNSQDRPKDEVEGSTLAYLAPLVYAIGIWMFFNFVVLEDPFEWISLAGEGTPVNAISSESPDAGFFGALGNALEIQLIFPATLVAIPLLIFNFVSTRSIVSIGIALLILFNIFYSVIGAVIEGSVDVIELRDALPGMLAGLAGLAWVYLRSPDLRAAVLGGTILLAVIALPTSWNQMESYPHQNLEQAFIRAVETGDDQEGMASRGGFQVGIDPERKIARFVEDQELDNNAILTDNARTFGVIALTGSPELFFDRVDKGDGPWFEALENPQGEVEFLLAERSGADRILERYPGADSGEVPGLEVAVINDRYVLLSVTGSPGGADGGEDGTGDTGAGGVGGATGESPNAGADSGGTAGGQTGGGGNVGSAPPITGEPGN